MTLHYSGDHTETTRVEYDPTQTNYSELLSLFWKNHDTTQKCSRQVFRIISHF